MFGLHIDADAELDLSWSQECFVPLEALKQAQLATTTIVAISRVPAVPIVQN